MSNHQRFYFKERYSDAKQTKETLISQRQTKDFEPVFSAYLTTLPLFQRFFFFSTDELNWLSVPPTALADVTQSHLHNQSAGTPTSLMFK